MYVRGEFGGEQGKQVCIMTTCIVLYDTERANILLQIANENKAYFGGKTEDRDPRFGRIVSYSCIFYNEGELSFHLMLLLT